MSSHLFLDDDFELPTPTARDFTEHPVRTLLKEVSTHGRDRFPVDAELDRLGLDEERRDSLVRACERLEKAHRESAAADEYIEPPYRLADELAARVIGELPERMRTASFWKRDPAEGLTDPGELASHVRRHGNGYCY
jgi:hypothetical protein